MSAPGKYTLRLDGVRVNYESTYGVRMITQNRKRVNVN